MALEGNSHKSHGSGGPAKDHNPMKAVVDNTAKRSEGLISAFIKRDGDNIKDYVIKTIVIPGIKDAIGGIGDIVLESLTDAVGIFFEKNGFSPDEKQKSGRTAYHNISKKRGRVRTRRDYDDEDDEEEESEDRLTYDNVRVKNERQAADVIEALRDRIDEIGYVTVANLYEAAGYGDEVTWNDQQRGWSKLDSASWVRSTDSHYRKKPWLIVMPRPKNISELK